MMNRKLYRGALCLDMDNNLVMANDAFSKLTPAPITGVGLVNMLGLKHDQRTGWFRWGENMEYGVRQSTNGWEVVKANSEDVKINLGKVFFIHEIQKIYNETNVK